jgi:hypothetical protein
VRHRAVRPAAVAMAAFMISGDRVIERTVGAGADAQGRLAIYRVTGQAIGDHALRGTGLGSFERCSRSTARRTSGAMSTWPMTTTCKRRSSWVCPLRPRCSARWPGSSALCARGARLRRRDAVFPCLGIAASVLVDVHALVDFSLQIPAVTATYLFLLGTAVAQSRSTRPTRRMRPAAASGTSGQCFDDPERRAGSRSAPTNLKS